MTEPTTNLISPGISPPDTRPTTPAESPPSALPPVPVAAPRAPVGEERHLYGWLFLIGLAAIFAFINPFVVGVEPRLEISLGVLGLGGALLIAGLARRQTAAMVGGTILLWVDIFAGTCTQVVPLSTPPGVIWGPRGLLLVVALLGWALFMGAPAWLWRGLIAAAVPTFLLLGVVWINAPRTARSAGLYWLAVDSHGALYATGNDDGSIWQFYPDGTVHGQIWPRRAPAPGTPALGYLPSALGLPGATPIATLTPGGPTLNEFLFCGLAVDPQDHLYVADTEMRRLIEFDSDGQVRASWAIPDTYIPARGCLAADANRVYLADRLSIIYVYDHQGTKLGQWTTDQTPQGMAVASDGRVLLLHNEAVSVLRPEDGKKIDGWALPHPSGALEIPYQAILARANGEVLITNLNTSQILRYGPAHQPLAPWSKEGDLPGEFRELAALAEDRQGRIYASDFIHRVIQRFTPGGLLDTVWSAPLAPGSFEID